MDPSIRPVVGANTVPVYKNLVHPDYDPTILSIDDGGSCVEPDPLHTESGTQLSWGVYRLRMDKTAT